MLGAAIVITRPGLPKRNLLTPLPTILSVSVRKIHTNVKSSLLIKRSNLMQQYADIYLLHSHLHVSGVTAPIIRSTKNCVCYLWYRS